MVVVLTSRVKTGVARYDYKVDKEEITQKQNVELSHRFAGAEEKPFIRRQRGRNGRAVGGGLNMATS